MKEEKDTPVQTAGVLGNAHSKPNNVVPIYSELLLEMMEAGPFELV